MKKIIAGIAALLISLSCGVTIPNNSVMSVSAETNASSDIINEILPAASSNLSIRKINYSDLAADNDGFVRVYSKDDKVFIENYDSDFNIISNNVIDMELSIWGGFYSGSDAYYLIEGENNTAEDTGAEVFRVIKYDKNWNRIGAAQITGDSQFGHQVRYPFDYSCVKATELNGMLYVVTGHEGYVDPKYNQGHQGFILISVDEASMTGKIASADLWHSFYQYIANDENNLYVLEQSEGSRYTKVTKYDASSLRPTAVPILRYGGARDSAWAIACYATADEIALSADNVLSIGASIDQSQYENSPYTQPYNIYLGVTPKNDFTEEASELLWLTDYTENGIRFKSINLTKINDDRFLVSWELTNEKSDSASDINDLLSDSKLHYVFIDGSGRKISDEFTADAPISDCEPIVSGSDVVYYAASEGTVNFYSINTETGEFSKKIYHPFGKHIQWNIADNVLTLSGIGEMKNDIENSPWISVSDKLEKIVISDGVTNISANLFRNISGSAKIEIGKDVKSIGENAFKNCGDIEEIVIPEGVKSIGDTAFAINERLKKVVLPESVDEIGEDIIWTGSYWIGSGGHVNYATIYAPVNSYAQKYAEENNLRCTVYNPKIAWYIKGNVLVLTDASSAENMSGWQRINEWNLDDIKKSVEKIIIKKDAPELLELSLKSYSNLKEVVIEKEITRINDRMFAYNSSLRKITLPESITEIGEGAFRECTSLEEITLGNKITKIGDDAFRDCVNLKNPALPTGLKEIGNAAFAGCDSISRITVPDGVKKIGDEAFAFNTNLKSVVIPASVTEIGEDILWTGSYWIGSGNHVNYASIYGSENTYAQKYAEENHISFRTDKPAPIIPIDTSVKYGDVNSDGNVDAIDASNILTEYALNATGKKGLFNSEQKKSADVTFDGSVDAVDASVVLSYYAYKATGGSLSISDFLMR